MMEVGAGEVGATAAEDVGGAALGGEVVDKDVDVFDAEEMADDLGVDPGDGLEIPGPVFWVVGPGHPGGGVGRPLGGHAVCGGGHRDVRALLWRAANRVPHGFAANDYGLIALRLVVASGVDGDGGGHVDGYAVPKMGRYCQEVTAAMAAWRSAGSPLTTRRGSTVPRAVTMAWMTTGPLAPVGKTGTRELRGAASLRFRERRSRCRRMACGLRCRLAEVVVVATATGEGFCGATGFGFGEAFEVVHLDDDVVHAEADKRGEQVLGGGNQHGLTHQAGGVADLGDVAAVGGDFEVIQIGPAEDDARTCRRGDQPHGNLCARVQADAAKLNVGPDCLLRMSVLGQGGLLPQFPQPRLQPETRCGVWQIYHSFGHRNPDGILMQQRVPGRLRYHSNH